ncbi:leucine-rich repeat-containing protein 56-like [Watersipora subatra]|uniref:leucine-rich repeat-containing protein 56-like n=1 Tax=Watersipora subatra TaxID=2589382 RepID=UPI00355C4F30
MSEPRYRDRPSTAGVHVTEHHLDKINPSPVAVDETELLIEEFLSPRKLRALTGIEDLEEVKYLEMRVDTSETSLGNFGALLPNLSQLKLNNSIISSVRDIGSSFSVLRILWMPRCNLEDLDGVTAMPNLKELYLAYNDIAELSPLSMMTSIEILDLEGNNISDAYQIEFLSLCSNMKNLTLEGNPICLAPQPGQTSQGYDYRRIISKTIPSLQILDDQPMVAEDCRVVTPSATFDSDWHFLEELQIDGTIGSLESTEDTETIGATAVPIRPTTGYRPGTSLRPTSAMKRLGTARIIGTSSEARPKTSQRPASSDSGTVADPVTDASDLTAGSLVCGNPARALRQRKRLPGPMHDHSKTNTIFEKFKHKPEHSYPVAEDEEDSLLDELKEWRLRNESVHKKLEVSRAPNVLTIDHDEDPVSETSDNEEQDEEDQGFVSRQDTQPSDEEPQLSPTDTSVSANPQATRLVPAVAIASRSRMRRYKIPTESQTAGSSVTAEDDEFRPISGPMPATRSFRSPVNKNEPKALPPSGQPIIVRADINSPEKPVIDRSSRTARAAVFSSSALKHHKLSCLPSRPTVPK